MNGLEQPKAEEPATEKPQSCVRCGKGYSHGDGVVAVKIMGKSGGDRAVHLACVRRGDYVLGTGQLRSPDGAKGLREKMHAERVAQKLKILQRRIARPKKVNRESVYRVRKGLTPGHSTPVER